MDIVADRHGASWQRSWDRRRPHYYGNRYYVFDDGFWYGLDDGYYPWDFDPYYPYAYSATDDNGYDQSADPYSASTISAVQSQLAGQGYYRGPVDGIYGRQTRDALTRYQSNHGLQVTGGLNSGTLQALGVPRTASN
jgi:hypothetical protein